MSPVLLLFLLLPEGVLADFFRFLLFTGVSFPLGFLLRLLEFQSLLCFGADAGLLRPLPDLPLHPLGIDFPFCECGGWNGGAELQAVPVFQKEGIHLMVFRFRAKGHLTDFICPAAFTLI